jgi:propionate catabolism operon transcriptional regulator
LPDILPLAEGFLKQSLAEMDVPFSEPVRKGLGLSQPTLLNYGWPGISANCVI